MPNIAAIAPSKKTTGSGLISWEGGEPLLDFETLESLARLDFDRLPDSVKSGFSMTWPAFKLIWITGWVCASDKAAHVKFLEAVVEEENRRVYELQS